MPSSLYGAGLPTCSIQFWFLQTNSGLAGGLLSVIFGTIQSDDCAHDPVDERYRDLSTVIGHQ
jgi:hypothetical protein